MIIFLRQNYLIDNAVIFWMIFENDSRFEEKAAWRELQMNENV